MKTNLKVYGQISLNGGKLIHKFEQPLNQCPIELAKFLLDLDIESSHFSTLDLKLSKRPILETEKGEINFDGFINEVSDSDLMDGYNNITWGEYTQLMGDPIFKMRLRIAKKAKLNELTAHEINIAKREYEATYLATKFHQIIESIES